MVIDVSMHNGTPNWSQAKGHIEGAIIRCGYGSDYATQDDKMWLYNVTECERLGIPYAVYLYSYAYTVQQARSEAEHAKRLCKGHKPSVAYFDSEEKGTESIAASAAKVFIEEMHKAGYKAGVYASSYWYNQYMKGVKGDSLWIAAYGRNDGTENPKYRPNVGEDLWQYSSMGTCPGFRGRVDVNTMYKNIFNKVETPAQDDDLLDLLYKTMKGDFGVDKERKKKLGKKYDDVQAVINHIYYAGVQTLAAEVMEGDYGTDDVRKTILGDRYNEVQDYINKHYY